MVLTLLDQLRASRVRTSKLVMHVSRRDFDIKIEWVGVLRSTVTITWHESPVSNLKRDFCPISHGLRQKPTQRWCTDTIEKVGSPKWGLVSHSNVEESRVVAGDGHVEHPDVLLSCIYHRRYVVRTILSTVQEHDSDLCLVGTLLS